MILLLALLMAGPVHALPSAKARVVLASGDVGVKREGKRYSIPSGRTNKPVEAGDWVEAGANSLAIIDFPDGARMKVNAGTAFRIKEVARMKGGLNSIRLDFGSIISKVPPPPKDGIAKERFRVETTVATMGVRGTQFYAGFGGKDGWEERTKKKDPANLWMCVNEGNVEVVSSKGGDLVRVPQGMGVSVTDGKVSRPEALQWTQGLNWKMDGEPDELVSEGASPPEPSLLKPVEF